MKRPFVLCLVLLLALGITGTGYAGWSEVLKFKLSAETGTLKVGVRNIGVEDPDGEGIGYIRCAGRNYEFDLDGRGYYESVVVDVYGAESYAPGCTVEIANGGTIPATINKVKLNNTSNLGLNRWTVDFPDGYQDRGTGFASFQRAVRDIPVDPGQRVRLEMQFEVKNEGSAGGSIDFCYRRWNVKR